METRSNSNSTDEALRKWLKNEIEYASAEHSVSFKLLAFEEVRFGDEPEVIYCAVERTDLAACKRDVTARVFLTLDGGYKNLSECEGPVADDCPNEILDLLTPTNEPAALKWRRACWRNALIRKMSPCFKNSLPFPIVSLKERLAASQGWIYVDIVSADKTRRCRISNGSEWAGKLCLHLICTEDLSFEGFDFATLWFSTSEQLLMLLQDWGDENTPVVILDLRRDGMVVEYAISSVDQLPDGHLLLTTADSRPSAEWDSDILSAVNKIREINELAADDAVKLHSGDVAMEASHKSLVKHEQVNRLCGDITALLGFAKSGLSKGAVNRLA